MTYTVWLIETINNGNPLWLASPGDLMPHLTKDAIKAIHFPTSYSGDAMIKALGLPSAYFITEHMFVDRTPTTEPVAEVVGDYNVQSLRYLPAGVDLKVGDQLVTLQAYEALQDENARLLAANRDCIDHFDALMADYKALQAAM